MMELGLVLLALVLAIVHLGHRLDDVKKKRKEQD